MFKLFKPLDKYDLITMEKELEVLWKFEKSNGYLFGNKTEIITLEKKIARLKAKLKDEEKHHQKSFP